VTPRTCARPSRPACSRRRAGGRRCSSRSRMSRARSSARARRRSCCSMPSARSSCSRPCRARAPSCSAGGCPRTPGSPAGCWARASRSSSRTSPRTRVSPPTWRARPVTSRRGSWRRRCCWRSARWVCCRSSTGPSARPSASSSSTSLGLVGHQAAVALELFEASRRMEAALRGRGELASVARLAAALDGQGAERLQAAAALMAALESLLSPSN
jgi:hypothetical protein